MTNLFINHYTEPNDKRNAELIQCLKMNLSNNCIDNIFALCNNEGDSSILDNEKVSILILKSRPTYNVFFSVIQKYTQPSDWNIIVNSDIYFDDSICRINNYNKTNIFIALTRYEVKNNKITFLNRPDSQDAWIFKGHPKVNCDFYMGQPGCDNVIAHRFHQAGYFVCNPSKTLKTYHLHSDTARNYTINNRLMPPYKLIQPTV